MFRRCFNIFWKAVKILPTEEMWFHFFDTFFELLKSNPDKFKFLNKFIVKLMNENDVRNLLKKEQYLCWVNSSVIINLKFFPRYAILNYL